MYKNQSTLEALAKDIGITVVTLRRFIIAEKDAAFDSLSKIVDFIEKSDPGIK